MYTVLIMMMIMPSEPNIVLSNKWSAICSNTRAVDVECVSLSGYVNGMPCLVLTQVFARLSAVCPRPSFQSFV